ncbi:sensor histidine kinase [Kineothrix sp. MB12-C1]|uniref:sensor histidine kinase n=1 Tax=Kineothrix sp. MB12-C1 TaxID=3070215 RepID=UPI0027D28C70|nr:histidine kinase [Kineothrix sp. MB12-C1]WMC93617.1 histidine kinase [Kineothrix sp. MB12-C1]
MNRLRGKWQGLKLNIKFTIIIIAFVIVPIVIFSMYLFYDMEKGEIREKRSSMEYSMESSYAQILKNIDSINMSTQFFLSDVFLTDYLVSIKRGESLSTEATREFYNVNIASLERIVNSNPYLYQIRVYADSDSMQEMMPILYRKERMERLGWASDENIYGWKYDYTDMIFDSYMMGQNKKIMSLVTQIKDFEYGELGTLEVALSMDTMFPELYKEGQDWWSCFVDDSGNRYYGIGKEGQDNYIAYVLENTIQGDEGESHTYYTEIEGEPFVIGYLPVKELSGKLIYMDGIASEIGRIHNMRMFFILIMLCILVLLIILINFAVKGLLSQFYSILFSIRQVQKGDLGVVIEGCGTDEMGELGTQINKMLERIRRLMEDNINRERLVKNSEIKALQNQINTHFIYNVLESIKMMAEIDEKYEISDAVTALGKLLRYSMRWVSGNVTVEEEIDYIKNYLALINLRFDYEIYLSLNMSDIIYKQEIPKMSLQPIVENAIYHGIEEMAENTNIYMKGIIEGTDCIIEITDAGKGMSEEEVERLYKKITGEIETSGGSGNGIGLKNVQDRIKMSFGERYGIEIASKLGCYTKIMVRIPLRKNEVLQ